MIGGLLAFQFSLFSQKIKMEARQFKAVHVSLSDVKLNGKPVIRITKDDSIKDFDQPTYARLIGTGFHNGKIEVKVLSRLLPDAPQLARGFIGIAFRINESDTRFENIYIRPTNGRSDIQLRRNRSVQYFSYPDYPFEKLRKDHAGEYESYADMGLNEWIRLRVVVKNAEARLFINDNRQPSLVVKDLKLGASPSGAIGLWVDVGTEGFFSDLKIIKE